MHGSLLVYTAYSTLRFGSHPILREHMRRSAYLAAVGAVFIVAGVWIA
jgi:hypothetical protein